jgi:hypothetical protein
MDKIKIVGDACHQKLYSEIVGELSFNPSVNFDEWKKKIHDKLYELLGMAEIEKNAIPLSITIEEQIDKGDYTLTRFVFESERESFVPCMLLVPNTNKAKYPLVIALQGHTSGFHLSVGEIKHERDENYLGSAFGIQAVKNGYACLCIEQRALGERISEKSWVWGSHRCEYPFMTAIMLGRTIIGERVWDVSRAIDLIANFDKIDTDKIIITGNSGGGTASYYSACLDERIKICVPSCAFSPYKTSIMPISHCPCNYIPNVMKWFEMQDLSCLIAPRKLSIVSGKIDNIFPIEGVREGYKTVEKIYEKAGVTKNVELIETEEGHFWHEGLVWGAINKRAKELGW